MAAGPGIRHVMFDADGVLQNLPGGWIAAAEPFFGARALEFLQRSYEAELPTLAGQGDHLAILTATLAEFEVTVPVADVYRGIWLSMEPVARHSPWSAPCARAGTAFTSAPTRNGTGPRTCARCSATTACLTSAATHANWAPPSPTWRSSPRPRGASARNPRPSCSSTTTRGTSPRPASAGLSAEQWCIDDGHDVLHGLLARHGVTAL